MLLKIGKKIRILDSNMLKCPHKIKLAHISLPVSMAYAPGVFFTTGAFLCDNPLSRPLIKREVRGTYISHEILAFAAPSP